MSQDSLKQKAVKGVTWTSIDLFVNMGFNFVIGVILARLLSPDDYGLIAMIAVFNSVANAFLDCGFGNAIIRKLNLTEDDTCTAFYFNLCAGIVLYGLLWLLAPFAAWFYDKPILSPLLRAESITLVFSAGYVIQNTLLKRNLKFKSLAFVNVLSNVIAGIVGIVAAYYGYGVWSLVIVHLSSGLLRLFTLWLISSWRPKGHWSKESFKYLWGFGSKLLASGVINDVYNNIYPIIIGKFFSPAALGQYSRADQYAQLPSQSLTKVLQQVTFPVLSQIQEDSIRLSSAYRRMLRVSTFIIFPVMLGLAALAKPLVVSLVTEKWLECVPYLQIICFASMLYPVHAINLNLLQVKGRSDLFLRLEIIKKIIITIAVFCSIPFGIKGMCFGAVVTSVICLIINTFYTGKMINVGLIRQMMDLAPSFINSLIMGVIAFVVTLPFENTFVQLAVGIPTGICYYILSAKLLHFSEFGELTTIIRKRG